MRSKAPQDQLTTIWLADLSASRVRRVENVLNALSPQPGYIQVSVRSKCVTVGHSKRLDSHAIQAALIKAGFNILYRNKRATPAIKRPRGLLTPKRMTVQHAVSPKFVLNNEFKSALEAEENEYVDEQLGPLRVTLSIGGMTCASCSTAVADTLSHLPGVTQPTVNLLTSTATMIVEHEDLIAGAVLAVTETGFEASLYKSESVNSADNKKDNTTRTICLKINGMFSSNCPQRVMTSLADFGSRISILKPLKSPADSILQLSYQPSPPDFTVRHIIAAITKARSPPFQVSLHQLPTIEEQASAMQRREQRDFLKRLLVTFVIAIPTFIIAIVYMSLIKDSNPGKTYLMMPMWVGNVSRFDWALLFLSTPVMFYSANVFHLRAMKEIHAMWKKGSTTPLLHRFIRFGSMNLLLSSGVSVAYTSSIALIGLAAVEPTSKDGRGDTTTYFDSVVFLTLFLLGGRWLEGYSRTHTTAAINALSALRPTEAHLLIRECQEMEKCRDFAYDVEKGDADIENERLITPPGLQIQKICPDLLEIGDLVRVPNGSMPPADGTVVRGKDSAFDESSLTGESKPIRKNLGDSVFMGTINKSNPVDVEITAIDDGTMLSNIIDVVRNGVSQRAPIERIATFVTAYFVPVTTLLALLTWAVWLSLGLSGSLPVTYLDIKLGGWAIWSLQFSIAVFVVACPCGIGLAAPTALLIGSGLAAKFGILARGGGEAFQEMAEVDIVVFDKTGTLTQGGEPTVSDADILPFGEEGIRWNPRLVLGIAAELESISSHPLGAAIRKYCQQQHALTVSGSAFEEKPGFGLKASFSTHNCTAILGNEAWMLEHNASMDDQTLLHLLAWKNQAKSVAVLAIQQETGEEAQRSYRTVAIFAVADPLRPEAKVVVETFNRWGLSTWMISGDNALTAMAVARAAGIPASNVIAGVLPHEKATKIQWLQKNGCKRELTRWQMLFRRSKINERCIVAMVGDGINDAPALTVSDIGIAIGSGSDVAISSAAFVLISSNLRSLLTLRDLSRTVLTRIKFNFAWAIIYNILVLPVAAGVLYPVRHIRLDPIWASLAMALSCLSVMCSSLLLKLYREPKLNA